MGRRISKEFLHPSILEGVDNKIGNLDNLETDAKDNMVQAINELADKIDTEIVEGKELIASAIGEPLDSNDTFSAMSDKINDIKSDLKQVLTDEGVSVTEEDNMASLIAKVDTGFASKNESINSNNTGLTEFKAALSKRGISSSANATLSDLVKLMDSKLYWRRVESTKSQCFLTMNSCSGYCGKDNTKVLMTQLLSNLSTGDTPISSLTFTTSVYLDGGTSTQNITFYVKIIAADGTVKQNVSKSKYYNSGAVSDYDIVLYNIEKTDTLQLSIMHRSDYGGSAYFGQSYLYGTIVEN